MIYTPQNLSPTISKNAIYEASRNIFQECTSMLWMVNKIHNCKLPFLGLGLCLEGKSENLNNKV